VQLSSTVSFMLWLTGLLALASAIQGNGG
jgi:hypothetical protein